MGAKTLFDFTDKTVIVTGGAVGIGKVYSQSLAEVGARVVIADVASKEGDALSALIRDAGGKAFSTRTDVTDMAACERMANVAVEKFGRIDGLVNNAALFTAVPRRVWNEYPEEEWDQVMAVNLKGIWNCTKAVYPQMKAQGFGKIVNISSGTWLTGTTGRLPYVTSKAGVVGMTRSLSHDLGPDGITINAVAPGLTKSDTLNATVPPGHWEKRQVHQAEVGAIPRVEIPEDLVGAVLFLLAPASDYMTGQTLSVDGGINHL